MGDLGNGQFSVSKFQLQAPHCIALCYCIIALLLSAGCASSTKEPPVQPPSTPPQGQTSFPAPSAPKKDSIKEAAAKPSAPFEGEGWQSMVDGQSLTGWRPTAFAGHGEVETRSGLVVLNMGDPFTGINWTNDFPHSNYEVALDAMRASGSDFFCGLTVPDGESFCSLIVGGWGGSLVGISSLDGMDASENQTTKYVSFEQGRWYRIRLRVTDERIEGWIDNEKLINAVTTGKRISLRPGEIEMSKPFGLASWQTTAALREIKWRKVNGPADPPPKHDF
jgi:hypothetical protein